MKEAMTKNDTRWCRRHTSSPIAQQLAELRRIRALANNAADVDDMAFLAKTARELAQQNPELREITSRNDSSSYDAKWNTIMNEKIKPFVLAHKAALAIAAATLLGVVLIMLTFNRYEFINVNGNLIKTDRLTGEAMRSVRGRGEFKPIRTPDQQKLDQLEQERISRMTTDELLRRLKTR